MKPLLDLRLYRLAYSVQKVIQMLQDLALTDESAIIFYLYNILHDAQVRLNAANDSVAP